MWIVERVWNLIEAFSNFVRRCEHVIQSKESDFYSNENIWNPYSLHTHTHTLEPSWGSDEYEI